jgi:hypothetical protein
MMAQVTMCDFAGCENQASSHVRVFLDASGPLEDWAGIEVDMCTDHDGLGPWIEQWEWEAGQDAEQA